MYMCVYICIYIYIYIYIYKIVYPPETEALESTRITGFQTGSGQTMFL